jgi:hypothetical protein
VQPEPDAIPLDEEFLHDMHTVLSRCGIERDKQAGQTAYQLSSKALRAVCAPDSVIRVVLDSGVDSALVLQEVVFRFMLVGKKNCPVMLKRFDQVRVWVPREGECVGVDGARGDEAGYESGDEGREFVFFCYKGIELGGRDDETGQGWVRGKSIYLSGWECTEVDCVGGCPGLDGVKEVAEKAAVCLGFNAKGVDWCLHGGTDLALLWCCSAVVAFAVRW